MTNAYLADKLLASHGYQTAERAAILTADGMPVEQAERIAIEMHTPKTLMVESPEGWGDVLENTKLTTPKDVVE